MPMPRTADCACPAPLPRRRRAGPRTRPRLVSPAPVASELAVVRNEQVVGAPYRHLSDEALVDRIGRAEAPAPALAELYDRYRVPAAGLARRIVRDTELAEDAVQEAFLHVWRCAARFSPQRGPARTWILTMVHHRAVDIVRSRAGVDAHQADGVAPEPPDPAAEDALAAIAERDAVRCALRSLPQQFRAPLALAYYADLSQQECATVLSEPLGTIKSRTHRGLTRLRGQLAGGEPQTAVAANNG
jgi:RNA polymerase sigma factor (sigma-70 family)